MTLQYQFLNLMSNGGPIMWVIFCVACIAMVMLIWEGVRGVILMKYARQDYQKMRQQSSYIPNHNNSPIAQLVTTLNWSDIKSAEDLVKELNIHLAEIVPKMSGSLSTIAVLGSLLPMLGLLGTVTGMINVFEVIALNGSGKPDAMADGISQALLTTASGLIIAIPVIFLHHVLSRRLNTLLAVTQQAIQVVLHRDLVSLKEAYRHEHD